MKPQPTKKHNPNEFYSVEELCALARVQKSTVWQWASQRKFTTHKIGGVLLFDAVEVNNSLRRTTRRSNASLNAEAETMEFEMRTHKSNAA